MSLADEARTLATRSYGCKTCELEKNHPGLREEIQEAIDENAPAAGIERALAARYPDEDPPAYNSLRNHIAKHL